MVEQKWLRFGRGDGRFRNYVLSDKEMRFALYTALRLSDCWHHVASRATSVVGSRFCPERRHLPMVADLSQRPCVKNMYFCFVTALQGGFDSFGLRAEQLGSGMGK